MSANGGDDERLPRTFDEIEADLNWIEDVVASASPTDDYIKGLYEQQQALLQSSKLQLEQLKTAGALTGGVKTGNGKDGGTFSIPEAGGLPEDAIGIVARDTQPNNTGPAVFELNGTQFYSVIKNSDDETMQAGTAVRVIGGQNRVTQRGAAGGFGVLGAGGGSQYFRYQGRLYRIPEVVTAGDQGVKVSNQTYVQGSYTSVNAELGPGETLEVARIEPNPDSFFLLKYTNATAHSTVDYNYYIDNPNDPDPDLSGSQPWATPPDLFEVIPDGWKLVEDFVSLELVETSGSNSYDAVTGTLTGLQIEV